MQHIGTFLHNEMGISLSGISPMCGRSSIHLQKIFFLRSIASVTNPCIGLMVRFYAGIEQEEYYPARTWEFQGTAKRIGKAIRIPYHYADENGNLIREHILVGFEGSGSD
jgi:hypothetical protein